MKNFKKINSNTPENNTAKPARRVKKRTVAAIVLTLLVTAGALTVIGFFGKKASQRNTVSASSLSAAAGTIELKEEKSSVPEAGTHYQYFAPAQNGSSTAWNLIKGGDLVEVNADYNTAAHIYKFDIKGKQKGVGDVELSYRVKDNQIKTAKLTLAVDENMNVSKVQ